jgi:hypothetical protein
MGPNQPKNKALVVLIACRKQERLRLRGLFIFFLDTRNGNGHDQMKGEAQER